MYMTEAAKVALGRNIPTASSDSPVTASRPTILEEIHRLHLDVIEGIQSASGQLHELHIRLIGPVPPNDVEGKLQYARLFADEGQLGQIYHQACSQRDSVMVLHQLIDLLKKI